MQTTIYADLQNPGRVQMIFNALASKTASEVAKKFSMRRVV